MVFREVVLSLTFTLKLCRDDVYLWQARIPIEHRPSVVARSCACVTLSRLPFSALMSCESLAPSMCKPDTL
jgi:hypothetical protein